MTAISLEDLHHQIAQRETELLALRQKLEARQGQLSELTRRKEELQSQLQQVEEEIASLRATGPSPSERPRPAGSAAPSAQASKAAAGGQPRLGEMITTLLRDNNRPMTARQLYEEAQRRGYPLASQNPVKAMESRLRDLKNQGVVRRSPKQPGYILGTAADGARKEKSKPSQPAPASTKKATAVPAKPVPATKTGKLPTSSSPGAVKPANKESPEGQPPLREVLRDILKNSRKPLSINELAERARSAGYKSNSTKFVDVVRLRLVQIDNVEFIPQKGYQLKRS